MFWLWITSTLFHIAIASIEPPYLITYELLECYTRLFIAVKVSSDG